MATETLCEIWAKRNPKWETRFEESLLRVYTDYGIGASEHTEAKGKTFGSGYELYIYAFFIGLYADEKRPLADKTKDFGHLIQFWGNVGNKKGRKDYSKIREYIFTALVAKTDKLDLIALEKGDITKKNAVDLLIDTMEQYANYGFYTIEEKMKDNPNYFYKNTGFLDMILDLLVSPSNNGDAEIEEL
jgi:hypothetical protein